ncbi:MAG: CsiV family protein [Sulfuricaulis sp.]
MKQLLIILILVITPCMPLFAADTGTSTANVYNIEVVVFENHLPDLEGGELWRNEPYKSTNTDIDEAVKVDSAPTPDSSLTPAVTALEKSGQHHVLAYLSWQQSAEAKSVSKPVQITSADGRLNGALRFYLSRYLMVDLNLTLRDLTNGAVSSGTGVESPPVYRLDEYRRVKLLETNYFDQPKFGVLVRVSPTKEN